MVGYARAGRRVNQNDAEKRKPARGSAGLRCLSQPDNAEVFIYMQSPNISSLRASISHAHGNVERGQTAVCNLYSALLRASRECSLSFPAGSPEREALKAADLNVQQMLGPQHARMIEHLAATRSR